MSKIAREIMTSAPQCCSGETTLNEVANLMLQADCGEIPVVDASNRLIGVITDRDIVCRVVAKGKNPSAVSASQCMSEPVICVNEDTSIDDVMAVMEENQIRRVPVVDAGGRCSGIISQADIAKTGRDKQVGELVREVSKDALGAAH
jgi:CBS domain-containing protein